MLPHSLKLKTQEDEARVIEFLKKRRGLKKFVRVEESVDIEGLLKDDTALKKLRESGLIDYREEVESFYIKPEGILMNFVRRIGAKAAELFASTTGKK